MVQRQELVKLIGSEEETEISILELGVKTRNSLLKKYIDLNKYLKAEDKENQDLMKFLKDDESPLDFIMECLQCSMANNSPKIDIDKIPGKKSDELFQKHSSYILGMGEGSGN